VHGIAASAADFGSIFVDAANNDYRLKSGSRAIDLGAGTFNGKTAPDVDLAGAARPQGLAHDAGAYEFAGTSTPDTTPPVISAVAAGSITSAAATITWTTDEPADGQIEYGTTTSYGSTTPLSASRVTSHSLSLSGLSALTTYHYRVLSKDAAGNLCMSGDFTFTTTGDTMAPTTSNRTPANGATGVAIGTNASATFSEAIQSGTISFVLTEPDGDAVPASVSYNSTTRVVTLNPTGSLDYLTVYTATLSGAADLAGNVMATRTWSFTTVAAPALPSLSFAEPLYAVDESSGTITITVTRTGDTSGAVSVDFATADGSAVAGLDYTATSGTLNFAAGATSATFSVSVLGDSDFEGNETILLSLSNPSSGAELGAPSSATLTILDGAPGTNGLGNGIAYDAAGNLHFVYNDGATGAIMYAVRDASGAWLTLQTVDAQSNSYPSMALDPTGKPGVAYYNANNGDLRYAHFNGSIWQIETVDSRRTAGLYPSLAYGASGRPVIAYYHKTYNELRLASFSGSAWALTTVDGTGDVGRYASLAQNPGTGRWAIGYVDASAKRAKFAEQTNSSWTTRVIDTTTQGGAAYVSLVFDASNRPAMSYYDIRNADLKVARFNGSVWSSQLVAAKGFVGMYSNIRIKAGTSELEVLYYNRERDSVFCADSSGSTWSLNELFVGGGRWLAAAQASDGSLTLSCLSGDGISVVDL
jgi:hypothetical protein